MTLQKMGLYTIDSVEVIADCALAAADKVVNSRHRILHIVALIQKSHKFAGAVLFLCWHSEGLWCADLGAMDFGNIVQRMV